MTLPAAVLTAHRCLTLIIPVVACCEVLSYRARSAADALREVLSTESSCGPTPPATFDWIAQLNVDLPRARLAMQPLLVTGVAWCMMWGSLVGIVWIGGDDPTALYAALLLRSQSVAACVSGLHASVLYGAARRMPGWLYPVVTLLLYALGYYVVLSGPTKVSSAVADLNSALAELNQQRRREVPESLTPPPAPSRLQWLMTEQVLVSMRSAPGTTVVKSGRRRKPTLESIPE